jgi:predicted enzyme related to lactoylglutathione lyase
MSDCSENPEVTVMPSGKKIKKDRNKLVFFGFEHAGLYPNKSSSREIAAWYKKIFGFTIKEEKASFFLSGPGPGRLEIMKNAAGNSHMHVAIHVSDFEAAVAELQAKGIQLKEPLIGPDLKIAYLQDTDPEGNPVHLWWSR